jgi:hypothetical protein
MRKNVTKFASLHSPGARTAKGSLQSKRPATALGKQSCRLSVGEIIDEYRDRRARIVRG